MSRLRMKWLLLVVLSSALLWSITDWMKGAEGASARDAQQSVSTRWKSIRERNLPDITLINHENQPVRFYRDLVKNQVVVVNFFYTGCFNTCPIATSNLVAVQKELERRHAGVVRFLSVSLNPEIDTPEVLAEYAASHGVDANWQFLTGRREEIELLRRSLGAYDLDVDVDADPAQHTGLAIIGYESAARWKAVPALTHPTRVRQAIERVILPVHAWTIGQAAVDEVEELRAPESPRNVTPLGDDEFAAYSALLAQR